MYFVVIKICINLMEIYIIKYFTLTLYTKIKGLSCLNWFGLTDRSHHNWDILKLSLLFPLIECATRTGLNKQHLPRRLHWFLHVFRCLNTRHQMCVTQKRIDSLSSVLFDETNNVIKSCLHIAIQHNRCSVREKEWPTKHLIGCMNQLLYYLSMGQMSYI